ncbi:MAG: hypothetical protein N2167_02765 [Flavobacteriales bacterium]|nr:hypothetical protein [Flavobacteriales bacterium]
MEHNEFEKYLREQADKFWLEPAPGSFGQVMEAMQRQKKRRRFLFILFFLLFILSGGSMFLWWITHTPFTSIENHQVVTNSLENHIEIPHNKSLRNQEHKAVSKKNKSESNVSTYDLKELSVAENNKLIPSVSSNIWNQSKPSEIITRKKSLKQKNNSNKLAIKKDFDTNDKTYQPIHAQEENYFKITTENVNYTTNIIPESTSVTDTSDSLTQNNVFNKNISNQKNDEVEFITDTPKINVKSRFWDPNRTKKWFVSAWFNGFAAGSVFEQNPTLTDTGLVNKSENYADYRNYYNTLRFGFSAGGSIGFMPITYLTIELGFQYTEFTTLEKPLGYPNQGGAGSTPTDVFPLTVLPSPEAQVYASNFKLLQIPLLFTFHANFGKSAMHLSAGPIFSYTNSFKGYTLFNSYNSLHFSTQVDSSNVQRLGIGFQSKLLYSYLILPNFSLYAGPTFQYRFNSLFVNSYIIRQKPYFIGVETGLRFHF